MPRRLAKNALLYGNSGTDRAVPTLTPGDPHRCSLSFGQKDVTWDQPTALAAHPVGTACDGVNHSIGFNLVKNLDRTNCHRMRIPLMIPFDTVCSSPRGAPIKRTSSPGLTLVRI